VPATDFAILELSCPTCYEKYKFLRWILLGVLRWRKTASLSFQMRGRKILPTGFFFKKLGLLKWEKKTKRIFY